MRLVVGCPIANRAWALPDWFRCLAHQSRRPDAIAFVHAGQRGDETEQTIRDCARIFGFTIHLWRDPQTPRPRHDNERFHVLARARNQLLAGARLIAGADLLLSLDSDVLLEDDRTIERLVGLLDDGYDTASPVTWLHPLGDRSWAYNAGWWRPDGQLDDPRRPWARRDVDSIPWGEVVEVDVPMAAILMGPVVLRDCRYRWHESGEDLGFAQALEHTGAVCAWDTGLKARHVWDESAL